MRILSIDVWKKPISTMELKTSQVDNSGHWIRQERCGKVTENRWNKEAVFWPKIFWILSVGILSTSWADVIILCSKRLTAPSIFPPILSICLLILGTNSLKQYQIFFIIMNWLLLVIIDDFLNCISKYCLTRSFLQKNVLLN